MYAAIPAEYKIKASRLIDWAEEISMHPNIQSAVCILLATFSQVSSKSQKLGKERKKNLHLGKKEPCVKLRSETM